MGITDVRNALQESAGHNIVIKSVTLGYKDGGQLQVLTFWAEHKSNNPKFLPGDIEVTFSGSANPVEQARKEGERLAQSIQEI